MEKVIYVCKHCGYTLERFAFEKPPVCYCGLSDSFNEYITLMEKKDKPKD